VSESREALAHQRLAARLLALRTRQLEDKLSRVSDDFVTPSDSPLHSCLSEDKLSPVSDYCVTPDEHKSVAEKFSRESDDCVVGSLQESNDVEDEFSRLSNNCVTLPEISHIEESSKIEALHQTDKSSELQSTVSDITAGNIANS